MKIVHICLCDPYNENWAYHRNILSEQNIKDGHDTYIITTSYNMDINGKHGIQEFGETINKYGIHVIRLKNKFFLPKYIQSKINTVKNIYRELSKINPDIIMMHNIQTFNLREIVRYKKNHHVVLLGDSHAARENSCRNFLSKNIVHGIFFRRLINKYFHYFDSFYYIGISGYKFFKEIYHISEKTYNILPLPARFISTDEKEKNKNYIRLQLKMKKEELLFVHSGKMVKEKKTEQLLHILHKRPEKFTLVIIGSIPKEQEYLYHLIKNDERFIYLGWKSSVELSQYISAADLYLQPGTGSVTFNNALAAGTPSLIYPHDDYQMFFGGWEFIAKNESDIANIFKDIFNNPQILKDKVKLAYYTARKFFDCEVFASEMYNIAQNSKYIKQIKTLNHGIRVIQNNTILEKEEKL